MMIVQNKTITPALNLRLTRTKTAIRYVKENDKEKRERRRDIER